MKCICCDWEFGADDEPIYNEAGSGPLCDTCITDHKCQSCGGVGTIPVLRDRQGRLDYLEGQPTGDRAKCSTCNGEGWTTQ